MDLCEVTQDIALVKNAIVLLKLLENEGFRCSSALGVNEGLQADMQNDLRLRTLHEGGQPSTAGGCSRVGRIFCVLKSGGRSETWTWCKGCEARELPGGHSRKGTAKYNGFRRIHLLAAAWT